MQTPNDIATDYLAEVETSKDAPAVKKPYLGIPTEPANPMIKRFRERLRETRQFHQAAMSSGNRRYLGIGYQTGWQDAVAYINEQAERDITQSETPHEAFSGEGNALGGIDPVVVED